MAGGGLEFILMYASVESGYLKGLYRANKKIAFLTDAPAKA